MARVTVEDCVLVVPNRFELVALASRRAKDIASGTPLTVDRDNDKDAVVALREIADETISADILREELVQGLQKRAVVDALPDEAKEEEINANAQEIAEEVESLTVADQSAEAGFSFNDENLDVED